jgi:UDP-3-O-[3-hydroxymyristoyl] glucosamine N-acyltransferase
MLLPALAQALNAEIDLDVVSNASVDLAKPGSAIEITDVATIEDAGATDLTFLANAKYKSKLHQSRAGAVLVPRKFQDPRLTMPVLRVDDPYLAFAKAIELFHHKPQPERQIHPTAVLGAEVELGKNLAIGAYVVIGNRVKLGDNVTIHPHCVIYDDAEIGADCLLHSHVVIRESVKLGQRVILQNGAVIGADGFGFAPQTDRSYYKIMQAGTVVLDDDVEVQVHTAIDRATIGVTKVGKGSKIDNLVQVGHGSSIGENTLLCGQVGLAGSSHVGNRVILAGGVGVAGHLTIGDDSVAAARSLVMGSLPAHSQVCGYPSMNHQQWLKAMAALKTLPELGVRVRHLEAAQAMKPTQPTP